MQHKNFYVFALLVALAPLILLVAATQRPVVAITSMSISDTGNISANSVGTDVTLTDPTVSFTLDTALDTDGQTIEVDINGLDVDTGFSVSDLSLSCNATGQTLEAAPGTADNGAHEVTLTNNSTSNSDPTILITLDNSTGPVAPSCSNAVVLTIDTTTAAIASSAVASNYAVNLATSEEAAGFFFYVGNENDVQVIASVEPNLAFEIVTSSDTTAPQPNVGGAAVGPNICDLGNLTQAGVQTCDYRLFISTNSASGYSVNIKTDGSLRKGTDFIANVAENDTVDGSAEEYGIALVAGASTEVGVTVTEAGDFTDDDTPIATAITTGIDTTLFSSDGPNNPATGAHDGTNTALVTHRAESDAGTAAGTYTQLVTYTVSATY